jgi:hypothetical protein
LLAFMAVELFVVVRGVIERGQFGADFGVHLAMAQRWLDTGVMYGPNQLVRPYTNGEPWTPAGMVNMYPPIAMVLFVPFLWLPAFLWRVIPLGTTAAIVAWWRPAWWSWPLMALALAPLPFSAAVAMGNSHMWFVAFIALATRWPAAAILLAIKPSVFPLALLFARSRSWWIAGVLAAVVSLAFGLGYWLQWVKAAGNLTGSNPWTYSLGVLPILLIPVLARIASTNRPWRRPSLSVRWPAPRP